MPKLEGIHRTKWKFECGKELFFPAKRAHDAPDQGDPRASLGPTRQAPAWHSWARGEKYFLCLVGAFIGLLFL